MPRIITALLVALMGVTTSIAAIAQEPKLSPQQTTEVEVAFNKANTLMEKNKPAEALTHYKKALTIMTNSVWRATAKPTPKEGERLFHLDGYFKSGGHATYGMFAPEPSYDEVRARVVQILEQKPRQ